MTKERELLRKALVYLSGLPARSYIQDEIEAYLSTSDDPEEPEAKPVLYIKEQELLYIQVLKQEGLAQEWKSNLGFVKEAGDVGLYLHPPKPAEPARKPMTEEEMDAGFNPYRMRWLADDQYFVAGVRFAEKHHGITDAEL